MADKSIADSLKGNPVIISDVSKYSALQYPEEAKKEGIKAIISIPISFSQEIIVNHWKTLFTTRNYFSNVENTLNNHQNAVEPPETLQ